MTIITYNPTPAHLREGYPRMSDTAAWDEITDICKQLKNAPVGTKYPEETQISIRRCLVSLIQEMQAYMVADNADIISNAPNRAFSSREFLYFGKYLHEDLEHLRQTCKDITVASLRLEGFDVTKLAENPEAAASTIMTTLNSPKKCHD
jgi:hypothetical protein